MAGGQLSTRYVPLSITTAAGTTAAAPLSTDTGLAEVVLLEVHLQVPRGHAGLTGIRFDLSGVAILPYSSNGAYFVGDDVREVFEVGYPIGSKLVARTYNVDDFDHTHYMLLKVTDRPDELPAPPVLLDPSLLAG